jgi:hypothetical protein
LTKTYLEGLDAPIIDNVVREVADLKAGEFLQVWHNGKVYHSGTVLRTVPSLGLVTIKRDSGAEVLIDAHILGITRHPKSRPDAT